GQLGITLREQNGSTRRFASNFDRSAVRFSTTDADVYFGDSHVMVMPDGDYEMRGTAREICTGSRIAVALRVHPAPDAYFPGVAMGSGGFVSGYTVPGLRASARG